MPNPINRSFDPDCVYNGNWRENPPMGFVTKLKVGDKTLAADQICKKPTTPTEDIKVVLVMDEIQWQGGNADAISVSGLISVPNRQMIAELTSSSSRTDTSVMCQFVVFDYDYSASAESPKYFESFHTNNTDIKGRIQPGSLRVRHEPVLAEGMPVTYYIQFGFKPVEQLAQDLHYAVRAGGNLVAPWGPRTG